MKKITILLILLFTVLTYAQKLEKVKGNKNVILTERKFDSIHSLELNNNIKLKLIKSNDFKLDIYADENLHDIVTTDLNNGVLSVGLTNRIGSKKEFELTLHIDNLKEIILNNNTYIENADYLETNDLSVLLNDKSRSNLFVKATNLNINAGDSTKSEFQIQSDSCTVKLQENAKVKGVFKNKKLEVDLESKSNFTISGNADNTIIFTKNNATAKMSNFKIVNAVVDTDNTSDVFVNASETLEISAKNKSKVSIYGNAKINLKIFKGTASLFKKE